MLRTLIKKEFSQLKSYYFFNRKTGKMRSKTGIAGMIVLYVFLFISVAFSFGAMSFLFADTFIAMGLEWLYFSMMGMIAIGLGVIGDVFNTYATIYKAKDNDLLLSMPIPTSKILISKLVGAYVMGSLFSGLVFFPATIVWLIKVPFTFGALICPIAVFLFISLCVTAVTCILGWLIALLSSKFHNKSFMTMLITLVLLAVYYVVYFRLNSYLTSAVENAEVLAGVISGKLFPFYHMGLAAGGNAVSVLIFGGISLAFASLTVWVMSKTYIRIVTKKTSSKKHKYDSNMIKTGSYRKALLFKEAKHFASSPTYMLNCGLGLIIEVVLSVFLLIKMNDLSGLLAAVDAIAQEMPWVAKVPPVLSAVLMGFTASVNLISSPSISLEGTSIWILQTSPASSKDILNTKLRFHILVCALPTLILSSALAIVLKFGTSETLLLIGLSVAYMVLEGVFGLFLDLRHANLSWTNEAIPIKQGIPVVVCMFGGWGLSVAVAGLFYLLRNIVSASVYMLGCLVVVCVLCIAVYRWLMKKGTDIFDFLK